MVHQKGKPKIELVAGVDIRPSTVIPALRSTPLIPKVTPPPAPPPEPPKPAPAPVVEAKPAPPPVEETAEPAPPRPTWTAEGRVYDMITLRPVFGAKLRFSAEGEYPVEVETNEKGRYRAVLPEQQAGYTLAIGAPDFEGTRYFDEIDPPYRTLELAERQQLQQMVPGHKPWKAAAGARLRRDLVVVRPASAMQETGAAPETP